MSEAANPRRERRFIYLLSVACAFIAVLVVVRSSPFQVRYNKWQMQRAWNETCDKSPDVHLDDGLSGYTLGESYERYTYHRQRLVELGAVRELRYRLRNVNRTTLASRNLIEMLMRRDCPQFVDFESPWTDKLQPLELIVWCFAPDADIWDQFIAAHDVAGASTPQSDQTNDPRP